MPPKRKGSVAGASGKGHMQEMPVAPRRSNSSASRAKVPAILPSPSDTTKPLASARQTSRRAKVDTNPDHNGDIIDGKVALRASPDADEAGEALDVAKVVAPTKKNGINGINGIKRDLQTLDHSDSPLSDIGDSPVTKKQKKAPTKSSIAAKKGSDEIKAFRAEQAAKKAAEVKVKKEPEGDEWDNRQDPDGDEVGPLEEADVLKLEAARPPPVNSDYLPLPWKGRLGYVSFTILQLLGVLIADAGLS